MKKLSNNRKLALSRETLRRLEAPLLSRVVGGTVLTCVPTRCTTELPRTSEETESCEQSW